MATADSAGELVKPFPKQRPWKNAKVSASSVTKTHKSILGLDEVETDSEITSAPQKPQSESREWKQLTRFEAIQEDKDQEDLLATRKKFEEESKRRNVKNQAVQGNPKDDDYVEDPSKRNFLVKVLGAGGIVLAEEVVRRKLSPVQKAKKALTNLLRPRPPINTKGIKMLEPVMTKAEIATDYMQTEKGREEIGNRIFDSIPTVVNTRQKITFLQQTLRNSNVHTRDDPKTMQDFKETIGALEHKISTIRTNVYKVLDAFDEQGIHDPNTVAYAMATIDHETDHTFEPIEEIDGKNQAIKNNYRGGENFFGRGFIQLTHDNNYKDYGKKIGLGNELYEHPEKALEVDNAAKIFAVWFKEKVYKISKTGDFVAARQGVNGTDKAQEIASSAQNYLKAILS